MSSITFTHKHQSLISYCVEKLLERKDVVKVISPFAPGWTWEVVNQIDNECFTCKVISPICPDGEWGEVDFWELSEETFLMIAPE